MQFRTILCFHENDSRIADISLSGSFPYYREQMTHPRRIGGVVLAMAARQTDGPYLPDVGLFGYFILANRRGAGDGRASACLTRVNGEVKVLFFHRGLTAKKGYASHASRSWMRTSGQYCSVRRSAACEQ